MTTLGIQRESLLNNPLLQKTELGRPLKHGFTLPPDGFTYGRPNLYIGSGAAEALCSWKIVKPRVVTKQPEERDFVRLNKMAVQAGLTSAPEQYQFRATHDVKVSSASKDRSLNKLKRIPPSMVFGVPTRPSTPVYDLLAHKYQDKWIEEKRKAEEAIRAKQDQKKRVGRDIYETRASLLRKHEPHVDTEPLWHMKKFERVSPRLETFRTGEAKKQAFKHHESDSTSRKGVFGHGLYETAKT